MDCSNINLKYKSSGSTVKELQQILKNKKYYTGRIDGSFGDLTLTAVKAFQKDNKLLVDGIVGPVTCKKLNNNSSSTSTKKTSEEVYISENHWVKQGCNKLGQCTGYHCGPHSIRQQNAKQDIDTYTEQTIGGWAGTTSAGTGHSGLETAIRMLSIKTGRKISVQWKNFSDMGSTNVERMRAIGKLISQKNKGVIVHLLYRNKWGHYESIKEINITRSYVTILNSLGNKCGGSTYCGYLEKRSFSEFIRNIKGISQKSIMILTYE